MSDNSQVESILNDIRKMVNNVIIKSSYLADEYETANSRREADRYISAYIERDTFNSYRSYPSYVLVNAGITNLDELEAYTENRHNIPRNKRKDVLKAMRKTVIDEYEEMNDYYRELIGKPSINTPEEEYIYLTKEEMEYYEIDEVRPIHDYPLEILIKLERIIIPELIEKYPERTYLKHMGSKAVNLVRARQAKNFEIIYNDIVLDHVFMQAFFETYDFCREYFMSMIYNKQFKARYDLYDNYIGMHIMIMTVQRLIVDTVKMGIDRDFYDLPTIKKMFDVYGVPFFDNLPLDYQRTIVKNLNRMIRSKSTDKVLYDIANTLFYERVNINKYYLVKERKFDESGEPIILYKNVAIEGEPEKVYLKSTNGKIYQLSIINDKLQTVEYTNTESVKTVKELIIKDEIEHGKKYKIYMKGHRLYSELAGGEEEPQTVYVYDEQNKRYKLTMSKGWLNTVDFPYNQIDDYTQVSTVRVFIRSSNNCNYELAMQGDRLTTVKLDDHTSYAPKSIYIKDEINGEKFRLFMIDDVLYAEESNDSNPAHQSIFLYDEQLNRYKLTVNKNKIQTSEYYYTTIETYDYEKMYDCYFQSTDILDKNPITLIENKYNRYEYDEVVGDDVYWWETEELKKELYEREYNFIDTKYIGITVMQNLTNVLYDTSYFLNLLVDHKCKTVPFEHRILNNDSIKLGTDYLFLNLNRLTTTPVSIFDSVIILCALISKKNSMKGNIIMKSPAQILSVLGFNFELNFNQIRQSIQDYKRIFKNQEIVKYLDLLDIKTVNDINTLYDNFRNFAEFCEDMIANTNDINEYKAYKELYKVITVRKDMTDLFKLSDGSVATTYIEYLYDKLPIVAKIIDETKKEDTGIYIEHVLGKLNELIPHLEYVNTLNGTNNSIITAIKGLINFFKSYTVDLRNLNIIYMFDNKRMNKIFMIDDPRLLIQMNADEHMIRYNDILRPYIGFDKYDNLIIYNKNKLTNVINPNEEFITDDKLRLTVNRMDADDSLELDYKDTMEIINKFGKNDIIEIRTVKSPSNIMTQKEYYSTEDIMKLYNLLNIIENLEFDYKDVMEIRTKFNLENNIKINTYKSLSKILMTKDYYCDMHDLLTLCNLINIYDVMEKDYKDLIKESLVTYNKLFNKVKFNDNGKLSNLNLINETDIVREFSHIRSIFKKYDNLEMNYKDVINDVTDIFYGNSYNIFYYLYHYILKIERREGIKMIESIKLIHEY